MSIIRSPELGGLTDNRVRAAMFYSRKRRLERKRRAGIITGTPPSLAAITDGDGDALSAVVTWGTYSASDQLNKQMRVNSGQWQTYVGATTVSAGEFWTVREIVGDALGNFSTFTSNTQEVTA